MNTDSTIGSSGDATPTDLTDRLHANLDYRATQFTVAAPPLSDILHRSRRRQARRHAVGILAGAGAMAVAGVAVIARPEPETEITTAAENEQGTTPPGTVRADIEVADPNACPASGAWYLGLRGGLSDGASLYPSFSRAGNHDITTRAQVFLTGEGAYGGKALFASRTTLPAGVNVDLGGALVYIPSGGSVDAPTWVQTTPYRVYPSGLLGSMGPLLRLTNEMVANPVDVGGVSGMYIEYGDGRAEVQWQQDHSMVRVVGQEVSRDELLAAALSVVPHDDGGFEVAHVPASLVPVVNTGIEDPGSMQSIFYSRSGVSVTVGTAAMTREQFLAELANRSAGRLERRDVNGHDGWVVLQDDIESAATWYDEGRQAAAVITISPMQGSVPAGMLDSVLADVIDLPEADVEAFCARMRFALRRTN